MYVMMNKAQFEDLESKAKSSKKITKFVSTGDVTGMVVTDDVTFDFYYDATAGKLNLNIGARHSLAAHLASDNIIGRYLTAFIYNMEPAVVPTPQPVPAPKPVITGAK